MNVDAVLTSIIYILSFFTLFFIGKIVNDLLHRDYRLNEELVEKDNPALALAISGYYLGLVLCIGGTMIGDSRGLLEDMLDLFIYGILSIILLNLSWFICDRLMLPRFKVNEELIRDQNQGTGAVIFGLSVATGLIIYGSVSGEGGNIWTAAAFWGLGQAILIVAGLIYNLITPYDLHDEIEKDNVAAGVSFAGALIAVGIIIGLSAEGDFTSWQQDLAEFILVAVFGLLLLPFIRLLTDKVLLPTVNLTDEIANQDKPNVGAAYIEACSYIASAFIIIWCV